MPRETEAQRKGRLARDGERDPDEREAEPEDDGLRSETRSGVCPGSGEYGNRVDYDASICPVCAHAVRHFDEDRRSGTLGARVRPHLRLIPDNDELTERDANGYVVTQWATIEERRASEATHAALSTPKPLHVGFPIDCPECLRLVLKSGRSRDWASAVQAHYQEGKGEQG